MIFNKKNIRRLYNKIENTPSNKVERRPFVGWQVSKSVALICLIESQEDINTVQDIVSIIEKQNKSVEVIYFYPQKNYPVFIDKSLNLNIITLKNSTYEMIKDITDNVLTNIDVLINLSKKENTAIQYMAIGSNASFKIALTSEINKKIYDMLFQPEESESVMEYYKRINQYIVKINN